jgi:hypothetical protein
MSFKGAQMSVNVLPDSLPSQPSASKLTSREASRRERDAKRADASCGVNAAAAARHRRRTKAERGSMRLLASGGIVGSAVILGAVLAGHAFAGWIVGAVVGLISAPLGGLPLS